MIIATGAIQEGTGQCISNHDSDGSAGIQGLAALGNMNQNCKVLDAKALQTFDESAVLGPNGLKQFSRSARTVVANNEKACCLFTTTNIKSYATGTTGTASINMAGGLIKVVSGNANFNVHDMLTGHVTEKTKIMKAAYDAIKEIQTTPEDYFNKDIDTIKTDGSFQKAFKNIYNAQQGLAGILSKMK
ncbi:Trypanosome variant surface glycoprotein (A-type) [Trypanosoma brucei equiperdum]|uniref:Trypanosome variant surface glycoprotein (A-type) n=1 Tax=Trypanosoma brucei equiperdum TaxID=630700 RepID=A0A3L6LCC5_9TRYP|nr:Trypanosome variant surface glycoprotein (A-type) [Trypanosoma brucei equiperdum]